MRWLSSLQSFLSDCSPVLFKSSGLSLGLFVLQPSFSRDFNLFFIADIFAARSVCASGGKGENYQDPSTFARSNEYHSYLFGSVLNKGITTRLASLRATRMQQEILSYDLYIGGKHLDNFRPGESHNNVGLPITPGRPWKEDALEKNSLWYPEIQIAHIEPTRRLIAVKTLGILQNKLVKQNL